MEGDGGNWPVISSYSRAEAIADGTLIAVPEKIAGEASWSCPVALTRAAWEDCVAWDATDNDRKGTLQSEDGRLWDVLWMASRFTRGSREPQARDNGHVFPIDDEEED